MSNIGRTNISVPGPNAQELELQQKQVELAELQLTATRRQSELAGPAFAREALLNDIRNEVFTPEQIRSQFIQQLQREQNLGFVQDELLNQQLERIRSGGGATEQEKKLIAESTNQAIALGGSDIREAATAGIDLIRNELAPSLGLRPGDSPILDRGGQVAREGVRQFGQLQRSLRGAQATAELNFPLARDQALAAQAASVQQLGQSAAEFQRALQTQAANNRSRLLGIGTVGGLGLSNATSQGLGIFAQNRFANQRTSNRQTQNFGAGVVSIFSSMLLKDRIGKADIQQILRSISEMDVDLWSYKADQNKTLHIGLYAEDFQENFKLGDGESIDVVDSLGILFAAVKAIAQKVGV